MFRMYFLTFEGEFRGENKTIQKQLLKDAGMVAIGGVITDIMIHEPHESPLTMTFPLMALAVPSVLIGLIRSALE
jgi:NAD(P)H-quinone oxidoreductase subunit 5